MRVTQRILTDRVMGNLNNITTRLLRIQDMLSSGKTLRRPSDDPVRLNRVLDLRTSLDKLARYQANIEDGVNWLSLVDESLSQVTCVLQEIRTLAIQGANGTMTATDREILAAQVEKLFEELVGVANVSYSGKYLFAGTQTLTPPFEFVGGQIVYRGDGASLVRAIEGKTTVDIGFPGDQVFFRGFEVWSNPITDSNIVAHQGESFTINGVTIDIDASIETVADLVNRINNDPILKDSAYAFFDGSRLFLRSRTEDALSLADVSGGTALQDWGILDGGGNIVPGNSQAAGGLFKVVQELIADLRANNAGDISGEDLAHLDQVLEGILKIRSQVGARTTRLENTLSRFEDFAVSFKELLSKNEDIDLAEVIMQLKEQESVYQTALAAAAQVIQPTLLDFLR